MLILFVGFFRVYLSLVGSLHYPPQSILCFSSKFSFLQNLQFCFLCNQNHFLLLMGNMNGGFFVDGQTVVFSPLVISYFFCLFFRISIYFSRFFQLNSLMKIIFNCIFFLPQLSCCGLIFGKIYVYFVALNEHSGAR